MRTHPVLPLAFLLAMAAPVHAQHRLTLGLGHTHISEGQVEGDTKWIAAASWSLNYDYWLSRKWALGLQNDVILESFVIEHDGEELIERSYPVSVVPVVLFKPLKHFTFLAGVGGEFASEKNLVLTRLGAEFGVHVGHQWEVGATVVWDNKWNYYNSWGIAFTVSRLFGGEH